MARGRDRTFIGEDFPVDKRVKRWVTLSSGYDDYNGRPKYISLNIEGHVIVMSQHTAS